MRRHRARHGGGPIAGPPPEPARPAGTDLLPQIKHIVVLMMENHSYDNYLGMLKDRGDGFPLGADGEPEAANRNADGEPVRAHHLTSTVQRPKVPSQSWHATHHQWGHGKHDGFVTSTQVVVPAAGDVDPAACEGPAAAVGMGYWTEDDLPFYYGLARTFPVADRWFSSCLGPTFPNRRFLIAGTAHGLLDDAPSDLLDYPPNGTIFDLLDRYGISWANYHPVAAGQSKLRRYARHERRMARRRLLAAGRSFPSVNRGVQKDLQFTADIFPIGIRRYLRHVHSTDQFFADADNGTLPAFSIVDPDFEAYSEENPQDIRKGESFAAEVINRCLHGKGWPGTLLIWVYDEHGGYYDHVPPPPAVPPDDVEGRSVTGTPSRLQSALRMVLPEEGRDRRQPGRRPAPLRPLRVPGAGRPGVALRPPRLRLPRGARPHLGPQAGRAEVEPAAADRQGRRRGLAARRARPDRAARLPRAAVAAPAGPDLGLLVTRSAVPTAASRLRLLVPLARAGYGAALLCAPGPMIGVVTGQPPSRRARQVARVLGVRHLAQAVITALNPGPEVVALGVVVDLLHAASMFAFAAIVPDLRGAELADALAATSLAVPSRPCLPSAEGVQSENHKQSSRTDPGPTPAPT